MSSRVCLLVATFCLAACVDETPTLEDPPSSEPSTGEIAQVSQSAQLLDANAEYDVCEHLPLDPPCSLACDYDALAATLPHGSCAAFFCTLTDGNEIVLHACRQ